MNFKASYLSNIKRPVLLILMLIGVVFNSCKKEQFAIPANTATIRFDSDFYIIERNAAQPLTVVLPLSVPLEQDATAMVSIDNSGTAISSQYTIDPLIPASGIKLSLVKGATQASFKVASLENFEGDITIVLKLSGATGGLMVSNTNASTTITIKGKPVVFPAITPSVSSLDAFGNVNVGSASASKSFTVSGVKITAAVNAVASANFKISSDNVTFTNSITISAAAITAAPVSVYVKFTPNSGVNQALSGTVTFTSGTVPAAVVSVSGNEVGNAAPGVLIKNEDFNYGAAADKITAASGGAWSAYSASGSLPVQYVSPGLTFTGYAGSGIGGAMVSQNNKSSAEDVSWDFPDQSSGVIYTSQLLNFASAPATADFFASLGSGAAGTTPVYYNRIYAKANGSQFSLGVDKNSTSVIGYSATNYEYGTTYLVVTKYDYNSGTSAIYVLSGAIPLIEPATPDATSGGGGADPAAITRFVIRQSTNLPLSVTCDGIRVATSWKQAVGL